MPLHGTDGPLKVSDHVYICDMAWVYLQTLQNMGVPFNNDFNSGTQYGVGFMQLTTDDGKRCSAVDAFVKPLARDKRLTVRTGAQVTRLLFEGDRCTGVEYAEGGRAHRGRTPPTR